MTVVNRLGCVVLGLGLGASFQGVPSGPVLVRDQHGVARCRIGDLGDGKYGIELLDSKGSVCGEMSAGDSSCILTVGGLGSGRRIVMESGNSESSIHLGDGHGGKLSLKAGMDGETGITSVDARGRLLFSMAGGRSSGDQSELALMSYGEADDPLATTRVRVRKTGTQLEMLDKEVRRVHLTSLN